MVGFGSSGLGCRILAAGLDLGKDLSGDLGLVDLLGGDLDLHHVVVLVLAVGLDLGEDLGVDLFDWSFF